MIDFYNLCKKYKHYELINKPPIHFSKWSTDNDLLQKYFRWICTESNCPSLLLSIYVPFKDIQVEVANLLDDFVKHRGDYHPGWFSITLHGVSKHITNHWSDDEYAKYNWQAMPLHTWTEIEKDCPITVEWLKSLPFDTFSRVRFMLLQPNGYIAPHQDIDKKDLCAYNIAITNPPNVEFAMEDAGLIPWKEGEFRAIDIGRKHAVRNLSGQNRIHMIIHGQHNNEFKKLFCESYDRLIYD
jgi:hypothetical protein